MRYGNIACRVTGSSVTWEGPDEIVRISLQPQPADRFPGEMWTLEMRGAAPVISGSFLTAEVVVMNVPLPDDLNGVTV